MENENLHKEIDLIQSCINRMANNSFLLKGWMISIYAVVLTLAVNKLTPILLLATVLVPTLCFWYLDAFFLRTEKMYRKMYEWVLVERKKDNIEYQYDLNPRRFQNEVDSLFSVMKSNTLRVFYGIPCLAVICVILYQLKEPICRIICCIVCKH